MVVELYMRGAAGSVRVVLRLPLSLSGLLHLNTKQMQ